MILFSDSHNIFFYVLRRIDSTVYREFFCSYTVVTPTGPWFDAAFSAQKFCCRKRLVSQLNTRGHGRKDCGSASAVMIPEVGDTGCSKFPDFSQPPLF